MNNSFMNNQDNSNNNTITIENPNIAIITNSIQNSNINNINSGNLSQGLFKVHKKITNNLINIIEDNEQKDKENHEIIEKINVSENIIITNHKEPQGKFNINNIYTNFTKSSNFS